MKKRILYILLILSVIVRISLYYEISISEHNRFDLKNTITTVSSDEHKIDAIHEEKKTVLPILTIVESILIIIFCILSNSKSKVYFKILRIDKRKKVYSIIINKMQGSIYKRKALIL